MSTGEIFIKDEDRYILYSYILVLCRQTFSEFD